MISYSNFAVTMNLDVHIFPKELKAYMIDPEMSQELKTVETVNEEYDDELVRSTDDTRLIFIMAASYVLLLAEECNETDR